MLWPEGSAVAQDGVSRSGGEEALEMLVFRCFVVNGFCRQSLSLSLCGQHPESEWLTAKLKCVVSIHFAEPIGHIVFKW